MKLIKLIRLFLWKYKRPPNPFSEAIAQGFKDALEEMGYKPVTDKT